MKKRTWWIALVTAALLATALVSIQGVERTTCRQAILQWISAQQVYNGCVLEHGEPDPDNTGHPCAFALAQYESARQLVIQSCQIASP